MTTAQWALLLSAAAFGFGVFSWVRDSGIQRRLAAIEEARRGEELSARERADVTAEVRKEARTPQSVKRSIVLINRGPARAQNVGIEPVAPTTPDLFFAGALDVFPVDLAAGQEFPTTVVLAGNESPIAHLRITWRDGRGGQTDTVTLHLE